MTSVSMPDPDDASALVAGAESYLAAHAPAPTPSMPAEGQTRRVRRLRGEVAEARQLAGLQDDDTPLLLDSPKVRRRRKAAHQAARLHKLDQDQAMRAWQAARMRRVLVTAALVSLALALGWSTAGVQVFAAEDATAWSARWCFAWCVEPFMSLALLTVVGAKAYMGTRGQPIKSDKLTGIEAGFLALTLGMNAWPHLPGVATEFSFSRLVLHVLGPVVAVAIVTALPIILAAFARLDHGPPLPIATGTPGHPATAGDLQWMGADEGASTTPPRGRSLDGHRAELCRLIAAGELPVTPSAAAIQRALGCRQETARQLRDETRNA